MTDKNHKYVRKYKATRVRKKLCGTAERPRLCVYKSRRYLYAQVVDDMSGMVLAGASTLSPDLKDGKKSKNVSAGKALGRLIGVRAKEKGVTKVCFDRSGYIYHGRVAAIADGAREEGIEF